MIKKPSNNYESPELEVLRFATDDIVRTSVEVSGDNYYGWDWESGASNGSDVFS